MSTKTEMRDLVTSFFMTCTFWMFINSYGNDKTGFGQKKLISTTKSRSGGPLVRDTRLYGSFICQEVRRLDTSYSGF